jgi:hypothetical protein
MEPPHLVRAEAKSIMIMVNLTMPSGELPPTRQRERAMKKFRSPGGAQRFLSAFSGISPHFRPRRHHLTATEYRHEMNTRFATWNEVVALPAMAMS